MRYQDINGYQEVFQCFEDNFSFLNSSKLKYNIILPNIFGAYDQNNDLGLKEDTRIYLQENGEVVTKGIMPASRFDVLEIYICGNMEAFGFGE